MPKQCRGKLIVKYIHNIQKCAFVVIVARVGKSTHNAWNEYEINAILNSLFVQLKHTILIKLLNY